MEGTEVDDNSDFDTTLGNNHKIRNGFNSINETLRVDN